MFNSGELALFPTQISLLDDIRDKMVKSITINLPVNDLNDALILKMSELFKTNPGKSTLKLSVSDKKDNINASFSSKRIKIDLNNSFINSLGELSNLSFKVN
jgi:DNA polymerase-3 subunit alpha